MSFNTFANPRFSSGNATRLMLSAFLPGPTGAGDERGVDAVLGLEAHEVVRDAPHLDLHGGRSGAHPGVHFAAPEVVLAGGAAEVQDQPLFAQLVLGACRAAAAAAAVGLGDLDRSLLPGPSSR